MTLLKQVNNYIIALNHKSFFSQDIGKKSLEYKRAELKGEEHGFNEEEVKNIQQYLPYFNSLNIYQPSLLMNELMNLETYNHGVLSARKVENQDKSKKCLMNLNRLSKNSLIDELIKENNPSHLMQYLSKGFNTIEKRLKHYLDEYGSFYTSLSIDFDDEEDFFNKVNYLNLLYSDYDSKSLRKQVKKENWKEKWYLKRKLWKVKRRVLKSEKRRVENVNELIQGLKHENYEETEIREVLSDYYPVENQAPSKKGFKKFVNSVINKYIHS